MIIEENNNTKHHVDSITVLLGGSVFKIKEYFGKISIEKSINGNDIAVQIGVFPILSNGIMID